MIDAPQHPLADALEPDSLGRIVPGVSCTTLSLALSAKRQADAMERIAKSLERLARCEYQGALLTHRRGG